jgi:hypothetical protein
MAEDAKRFSLRVCLPVRGCAPRDGFMSQIVVGTFLV